MLNRIGVIIIKEFRQKVRGLSTVGILTFFLSVIAIVAYLVLLTGYGGIAARYSTAAAVGRNLAISVLITQLVLTAIFGLSFNGSAITQERDRETIDLLNLTLLGNAEIIVGKLLSSMLYILLMLFAGLPFFTLSYTFGGWELVELLAAVVTVLSLVTLVSSCGLLISVTSKDTRTALGRTFATLIFVAVGTIYFGIRYMEMQFTNLDAFHKIMGVFSIMLNPGYALLTILYPDMQNTITTINPTIGALSPYMPFWVVATIFQLLISLFAIIIAIRVYGLVRKGER
jgi:ABC-2 type transport system permease protein